MSYANQYAEYGTNPYTNAPNLEAGQGGAGNGVSIILSIVAKQRH
jgi:hypothetical protein